MFKNYLTNFLNLIAMSVIITGLLSGCGAGFTASTNISGTLSGIIPGTSLVLQNNGTDNVTISSNGNFIFPGQVEVGKSYSVTVAKNPLGQTCSIANGAGTIGQNSQDVTNMIVSCQVTNGAIIGVVSGLVTGATVSIVDPSNSPTIITPDTLIVSSNGYFAFPTLLKPGTTYAVIIDKQPQGQTCTVSEGSGIIQTSGAILPVLIACV